MKRCPNCGFLILGNTCSNCKLSDYDSNQYLKFCGPALIDKTINTLEGIICGVELDAKLTLEELNEIRRWQKEHAVYLDRMPYHEIIVALDKILADGMISTDEKEDILWVCHNIRPNSIYYDSITSDLQRLQGILHGIIADKIINKEEILGLQYWLENNKHLSNNYPYDEIFELVEGVLYDGVLSQNEVPILKNFFAKFCEISPASVLSTDELVEIKNAASIYAVCSTNPQIIFRNNLFCFTGKSSKGSRKDIADIVINAGGLFKDNVVSDTKYLIVGDDGNPCWAFACYGRKIEKAIVAKRSGQNINIVHETSFWKCLQGGLS